MISLPTLPPLSLLPLSLLPLNSSPTSPDRQLAQRTLVIPDVFGATDDLRDFAAAIAPDVTIVDVYQECGVRPPADAASDSHAYQWFQRHIGQETYATIVRANVTSLTAPARIVGFSMGAAMTWQVAGEESAERQREPSATASPIDHAICFYGSQIRHLRQLVPAWPVHCVFPQHEPHFDVLALAAQIARHPRTQVTVVEHAHGFLNAHSAGYCAAARREFAAQLRQDAVTGHSALRPRC